MVDEVTPPAGGTPPAAPASPAPGGTAPAAAPSLAGGTPPLPSDSVPGSRVTDPPKTPEPPAAPEFKLDSIKMPDGVKLEGETRDKFEAAIKEADPVKRAENLLNLYQSEAKRLAEAAHKGFFDLNKQWADQVKSDPEIGGDKWAQTAATIAKALDQFGTPGVRQALNLTGAGNNPDVIKTFYKMAAALAEGSHVGGKPPAQSGEVPLEKAMYPNMNP